MANALGELFGNIANSIRNGLGDVGKMKPNAFPGKIDEIVDLIGDNAEEIDLQLDRINGEIIGEELYYITFMNGEELIQVPVYEGYNCDDPVATGLIGTPTRENTKYIAYTFAGWSLTDGGTVDESALLAVEENRTVYAVFAEEYIYVAKGEDTGEYGSLRWTLNPDYVLTVESNDYNPPSYDPHLGTSYAPWWKYREEITSFVAKGTTREVGGGWLYQCTKLASVTIPSTFTSIGMQTFAGCTALTSITLPTKIRVIGNNAFDGASIESITLPAETYFINKYAFRCDTLKSVVFERADGWSYADNLSDANDGNGTVVSTAQAADPTFAVSNFKQGSYIWVNSNLA